MRLIVDSIKLLANDWTRTIVLIQDFLSSALLAGATFRKEYPYFTYPDLLRTFNMINSKSFRVVGFRKKNKVNKVNNMSLQLRDYPHQIISVFSVFHALGKTCSSGSRRPERAIFKTILSGHAIQGDLL